MSSRGNLNFKCLEEGIGREKGTARDTWHHNRHFSICIRRRVPVCVCVFLGGGGRDLHRAAVVYEFSDNSYQRHINKLNGRRKGTEQDGIQIPQHFMDMQKEKLDQVLSGGDLQPRSKPELSSKQTGGLEKASLAVIAQCMEVLSLGGAQLNDLLRTLADRFAPHPC